MMANTWDVYVGSETGLFKGVNTEKKEYRNFSLLTECNRDHEITSLCWSDLSETSVYVGQKNQTVKLFDCNTGLFSKTLDLSAGDGVLRGVVVYNGRVVTAVESGLVQLWDEEGQSQLEINAGEKLFRMRQNPLKPELIATGGEENDLKVWDLQSGQSVFKAKNVRNDFLDLRVPVWITDMQFVPDSDKIITCTRHHQVRLYDPRASQRRPVIDMEFERYPLMSLSLAHQEHQVVVGSSRGRMALLDLRKKSLVHVFKGFAGSIRCVQCHPTLPLVASCGLDRFLRIHELNSHKLVRKIYLKARLNCLLMKSDISITTVDQPLKDSSLRKSIELKNDINANDDDDAVWHSMKTVKEKSLTIKRSYSDQAICLTGLQKKKKKPKLTDQEK